MFWNIYSKRVLMSFRNWEVLLWTWIFPIILGTLFYATFGAIDTEGQFSRFPLGVVDSAEYRGDAAFKSALESVSGDDGLFDLKVFADRQEADAALEGSEVEGYVVAGETPTLMVTMDGINQTIAKSFLDQYLQTKNSVSMIVASNPALLKSLPELLSQVDYMEEISLSHNPPTNKVNYFYALLAMVCLYGGFQGLTSVTYVQANLSALGARRTMTPFGRFKLTVYDLLGGITVQFACLLTVVAYIVFALRTSFGSQTGLVLLTCLAGSMLGVAFGAMVSVTKLKEQAKIAILITITMVCCFLSGMMVGGINYVIAEKAPIVSWLNPAARISDAFYCLYYYDTYDKFFLNIGIILAMTVVLFAITSVFLRRQRYESI